MIEKWLCLMNVVLLRLWPLGMIHSGIEGWWQASFRTSPPRPLSVAAVTMSVTLMAASCDSIGSCSLDVDAESLADSSQVDSSLKRRNAGSQGCWVLRFVLQCIFLSKFYKFLSLNLVISSCKSKQFLFLGIKEWANKHKITQ